MKIRYFALFFILCGLFFSCVTPSILVTKEQNLGDTYFNQHQYAEAAIHYQMMLDASNKLGVYRNLSMEADVHRKIASCNEMNGDYEKALQQVHYAMQLDSADNNLLGRIGNFREEGKIFIYMGSYNKGIESIEKSLALAEGMEQSAKNVNKLTIADNYLALGQLYSVTGKIEKAREYSGKALDLFRQAGDRQGEMESLLVLGNISLDLGDLSSSRNFAEQSAKFATELDLGTARQNQLLATIFSTLGKFEDAVKVQDVALQQAEKVKIAGQIIWASIGMGDIYRDLGDSKKAGRYYRQAGQMRDTILKSSRSIDASIDMRLGNFVSANGYYATEGSLSGDAISSLRLSEMYLTDGKSDSAMLLLDHAGKLFRQTGNVQGLANVNLLMGSILVDRGDENRAARLLDSAKIAGDFPETVWQAWFHLGRMYETIGQAEKAMEAYRQSIAVIEKIRGNLTIDEFRSIYFDSKRKVYDRLINLLLKGNNPSEAFQISEQARARAFYDILAGRKMNFKGPANSNLVSLEQEKRIEMQKLYKLLQKGYSGEQKGDGGRSIDMRQVKSSLVAVQTQYEDILQKLKLENPAYADLVAAEPVRLEDISPQLDDKTAVLEYWINEKKLFIWLLTRSGIVSRTVEIDNTRMNSLVEKGRIAIMSNASDVNSTLSELYKVLIGPVENDISKFANLVVIPNQSLHMLPFQALRNGKGEFLMQRFNIEYEPSLSVWNICSKKAVKPGNRFLGMALSDTPVGSFSGLPGTEEELKKILPLFSENISAFGTKGTETFARQNAEHYNYLHFATHGSYNYNQPLYSFLLFPPSDTDDGRLNVYEVFEMNLEARLVTLSACETGLGNLTQGDEVTGLSRAFLYAGASAVVVSLWSVADYPTSLLMSAFYGYLKDHTPEESLTLAQRDVVKKFPQPLYWAPFVIIGNGSTD